MNLKKEAQEIIHALEQNRFYAECPCCGETIQLKKAGLFYLDNFTPTAKELYNMQLEELGKREKRKI